MQRSPSLSLLSCNCSLQLARCIVYNSSPLIPNHRRTYNMILSASLRSPVILQKCYCAIILLSLSFLTADLIIFYSHYLISSHIIYLILSHFILFPLILFNFSSCFPPLGCSCRDEGFCRSGRSSGQQESSGYTSHRRRCTEVNNYSYSHSYSILFYSILFHSILFYFILFYSILFYSILFHSLFFPILVLFFSSSSPSIFFFSNS